MNDKCRICNSTTKLTYKNMFDDRHGYPGKFKIYKCVNCGFMQTKPQLTFGQLTNVYTRYYPKRDADIKSIVSSTTKIPSEREIYNNGWRTTCHFQTKRGQKVLDVGCGTCQSLLEIKKLGGKAWGIDPDKNAQVVAKKLKLNFQLGTIHGVKLTEKFFDLITASQVLEHEGNPLKFLKTCSVYLKNNGKIILSFPNTGSLFCKIWGRSWLHWHIPYHLNHFNKKSLVKLIDKSGLKLVKLETVTPNLWTVLQLRSYLSKPKIGKRNPMWDGKSTETTSAKLTYKERVLSYLLYKLNLLLKVNRLIDRLGLGESFFVILSK